MLSSLSLDLAAGLFLMGSTLLGAFFYLRSQSYKLKRLIQKLYQVNADVESDVLDFIECAWPVLQNAGIRGLKGSVLWYGEKKTVLNGEEAVESFPIVIDERDIQIDLILFTNALHGENRLLSSLVIQTFSMLLSHNVSSKISQFLMSQKQLERYQLFVQHDVKNIAQFISLLDTQIAQAASMDAKMKVMDRLAMVLPSISEKANKVISQLQQVDIALDDVAVVSLSYEVEKVARVIELSVRVEGEETISISEVLLSQVLNNILANFKDHSPVGTEVYVLIQQVEECVSLEFSRLTLDSDELVESERLFEPFWTTSQSGMGLGLFLTRELLHKLHGSVSFYQTEDTLGFKVLLPRKLP